MLYLCTIHEITNNIKHMHGYTVFTKQAYVGLTKRGLAIASLHQINIYSASLKQLGPKV